MNRSVALAAILTLGGVAVSASAAAYLAPSVAAHPGPAAAVAALTTGAPGARALPSQAAKTAAPTWLAICGMSVNKTWPSRTAGFGPENVSTISAVKLQCYFSDSPNPLHQVRPPIDGIFGPRS